MKEVSLVAITLDFTGSENIKIENQPELLASAQVRPMSTHVVACVRAYDVNWNTQVRIKLTKLSPSLEEQERFIRDDRVRLEKEIREAEINWGNFPLRIAS